jgi:signal transduction histidine kinase
MNEKALKVLLVEDNAGDARLLREMFSKEKAGAFELTHLLRMSEAVIHLAKGGVDIVLLDMGLPDGHGLNTVQRAHAAAPDVPLIVLTGLNDETLAAEAMKEGAQDYLIKGQIENRALPRALRHAIERHRMQAESDLIQTHRLQLKDELLSHASDELRITELKQAQAALLVAKEDAERSNKFKDHFLSTMSHELRTPLNAVLGFSDLLKDERYGPLNERQRRYVNHIHVGGQHLLRLINDILDLSKIQAGRLQLAIESVQVNSTLSEVADALRPLAEKKSQTLIQHTTTDLSVRADATRFKQILMNLLGNAIKFTPDGGKIELGAHQLGAVVRVEVRDTGPGIPLNDQQRIFESFYRLERSDELLEGTGLGLAITRRLVELHGGRLGLESQPGSGSCFYFTLSTASTLHAGETPKTSPGFHPCGLARILVVEEEIAGAQLLQSQLSSSGYEVVVCNDRQKALEMAASLRPDAITLDIMVKPGSGWELLSALKSDPRTAKVPVIVVTIVDQPGTGALLGADEYVVKPVEKATLLGAVERCLNLRGQIGDGRSILVVEDDAPTREFIAEMLSNRGYLVSTAADGAKARTQVAASLPELVILDLILPEVSGFELLAEWKGNSRTADLPVFVLTSKDLTLEERNYLRSNAEAFFYKQERWQEELIKQLQRAVPPVLAGKS